MDTWSDVKDIEVGTEVRVSTKHDGFVHGTVTAKDEDAHTLTIGEKVVEFDEAATE